MWNIWLLLSRMSLTLQNHYDLNVTYGSVLKDLAVSSPLITSPVQFFFSLHPVPPVLKSFLFCSPLALLSSSNSSPIFSIPFPTSALRDSISLLNLSHIHYGFYPYGMWSVLPQMIRDMVGLTNEIVNGTEARILSNTSDFHNANRQKNLSKTGL